VNLPATTRRRALLLWLTACLALGAAAASARADVPASAAASSEAAGREPPAASEDEAETDPAESEDAFLPLGAEPTSPFQPPAPAPQPPGQPSASRPPGRITLRKFRHLEWSPDGNSFKADGLVMLDYFDPVDSKTTTLTAQDVSYDSDTGLVEAKGGFRLERAEGVFTGQEIHYNFQSRAGYILDAIVESEYFRMRGRRIETQASGVYVVTEGVFTTCLHGRSDYHIRAGRLEVLPGRYVSARKITFYAGPSPLITLPSYRQDLSTGSSAPLPLPGYTPGEGFTLSLRGSPLSEPNRTFDYDVKLGFKRLLTGTAVYQEDLSRTRTSLVPPRGLLANLNDPLRGFLEQLTPPTYHEYAENRYEESYGPRRTFYTILQRAQTVYNRERNDLTLSRFPEIGIRFSNLLGHAPSASGTAGKEGTPPPSRAALLLDASTSLGAFQEDPTKVTAGRLGFELNLASPPFTLGRRLSWRVGLTNWLNVYTTGTAYNLLSPEIQLDYLPTRTSIASVGYRNLADIGSTPFLFDQRDVRNELRLQYQVGGPWGFGIATHLDLNSTEFYETQVAVQRNFDCMQVGVAYRFTSNAFVVIFRLLPPTADRSRIRQTPFSAGGVGTSVHTESALPGDE
jgi:hypothetical protein